MGLSLDLRNVPSDVNRSDVLLFSESTSRFLVEVKRDHASKFEEIIQGVPYGKVGFVGGKTFRIIGLDGAIWEVDISELRHAWRGNDGS